MSRGIVLLILCLFFSRPTQSATLSGVDLYGEAHHFETKTKDEYLVLIFISSRCPCSLSHEAEIKKLAKHFATKSFEFVGILSNKDEDLQTAQQHFQATKLPFPILNDQQQKLANKFRAYKTPHVFVLNHNSDIVYQGAVSNSRNLNNADEFYLMTSLSQITRNQKIDPKLTRALGCEIYR